MKNQSFFQFFQWVIKSGNIIAENYLSIKCLPATDPFRDEYKELNDDLEDRLKIGQLGRFSSIVNQS